MKRMEYTVLGDCVNLSARSESVGGIGLAISNVRAKDAERVRKANGLITFFCKLFTAALASIEMDVGDGRQLWRA
eukprot:11751968-Heterocapsa_arctica.AAC.1